MDRERDAHPILRPSELREHLTLLRDSSQKDLDELLTDLLVHAYASKAAQDC